jgi:hypothetical protein
MEELKTSYQKNNNQGIAAQSPERVITRTTKFHFCHMDSKFFFKIAFSFLLVTFTLFLFYFSRLRD